MNGSNKRAIILSVSVMAVCILTIIAGGSFSLLWIQHEVSCVAKQTVLMEKRHQEILRKLNHLDGLIANEHQPIRLQSKVSNRLVPMVDKQIVWVETNTSETGSVYVNAQNGQSNIFKNQF
ncbi:MAG: hypothetical protein ACJZ9B_00210 [Coraliomargaritaceae bacterium]